MKLHVLGSAGYHPNGWRETTCLMVPELGIIFDAGSGFYRIRSLLDRVPAGMPLKVFLSHGHIDHTVGLTYGINMLWGTGRKLDVIGHETHLDAIEGQLFGGPLFPLGADHRLLAYGFERWAEGNRPIGQYKSGTSILGNRTVGSGGRANGVPYRVVPLPHPGGSMGYRLSLPNGRDLVYVTDTCADDVPLPFVKGAHTLVHECNFTDDLAQIARDSGHSTTSQVFRLAERAGVERLVCIHWNTMLELVAGRPIKDMTGRDPNARLPFELVLADDSTVIDL